MRGATFWWLALALGPGTFPSDVAAVEGPIRVPQDQATLQEAIEAAGPGDVILLDRGTYPGEVVVPEEVRDITIRGVDRNAVIFDGNDVRKNAIFVEGDGVTLENMTAHNFQGNGFYWAGVEEFIGRYLTVYNVGLYGIYAIQSRGGLFEHSLVSGAADAAFYIGECSPCDTVLTDLTARLSAVGYSGTNASGNVIVKDSLWELNRVGILPNCYDVGIARPPQRGARFTGNVVRGSGTVPVPINTPLGGFRGIGIGIAGGIENVVENNIVEDSARYGIAVFSTVDAEERIWTPEENRITSNQVRGSGTSDLALAAGSEESNCFQGNPSDTELPTGLNGACDATLAGSQAVADELVLPPPELAEQDRTLEQAPSYMDMEPPSTKASSSRSQPEPRTGSGLVPVGVVAVVAGAALLWVRRSGRGPTALLVAGGILLGAGSLAIVMPLVERDLDAPARSSSSGRTVQPTPSDTPSQREAASAEGRHLSVVEVSTLDRLPGTQGETLEPKKGRAFLVVEARLQSTDGPAELSSEQGRIVSTDGKTLKAIGAGEKKFCVQCQFGVSADTDALLSFVFLIGTGQTDETFQYEGFPEILISGFGDVYPSGVEEIAPPRDQGSIHSPRRGLIRWNMW